MTGKTPHLCSRCSSPMVKYGSTKRFRRRQKLPPYFTPKWKCLACGYEDVKKEDSNG